MSEIVLTCDTVVIGAGTAGVEAFKAATDEGVNCVLVESGPLGTSWSWKSTASRACMSWAWGLI